MPGMGMAWIRSGREQKSPDGAVKAKQGRESKWQRRNRMDELIKKQDAIDAILGMANCKSVEEVYGRISRKEIEEIWGAGILSAVDAVKWVDGVCEADCFANVQS